MATELNTNDDSDDLWNISNAVLDNYNEENVLKHLEEKDHLRADRHIGFDNNSGDTWIYPTNYPVRKYQHDIVYNALFKNTLVCLPTGLGKTFIAAVVMYNFYRWYPQGKLIFMAPTKPLVAQQIDACYQIMGISKEDTAEITGQQKKENRLKQWQLKRVFYATPQSVVSDIDDPNFPTQSIKLVVIDEAHKAKGKYAYCEVIRIIREKNEMFRVLALSATPGRKANDVAEVVHNLLIGHIEVRTEKCSDVIPYVHRKRIETIVVRLTENIRRYHDELISIIDPYVRNLIEHNVIDGTTNSLNRGWLVMQKQKYMSNRLVQTHPHHSAVMTDFACCICLYHALELLERHGLWPFVNYFDSSEEKFIVAKDYRLKQFLMTMKDDIGTYPFANGVADAVIPRDFDFGHPKYDELQKCLAKHLASDRKSQAIVFCEFRDSAFLIHQMLLLQKEADIKPAIFIGQGSSTAGQKGITQKQQIATMADFRKGIYNVLIATCVAEEGIDCGEVDLIVCFDVTSKNPTRLVQRMGRTGRKRNGVVCLLVTEGKEHNNLKESMTAKEYTNKKLVTHSDVVDSLCQSPRLIPSEFNPKCVETFIQTSGAADVPSKDNDRHEEDVRITSDTKRSAVPPPSTSRDLRTFFQPVASTEPPPAHRNQWKDSSKQSIQPPRTTTTEPNDDVTDRLNVPTFWDIIEDVESSSALKAFAVKRNVCAWKDQFAAKTLSPVYEAAITSALNNSACIAKLMNDRQSERRLFTPCISELNSRNVPHDPTFVAKLVERFIRAKKMSNPHEKSDDISTASELISQANNTSPMDVSISSDHSFVPFFEEIESKYEQTTMANQTAVFGLKSPGPAKRTPLKSSTPLIAKKAMNRSNGSIKNSPLARAFEKCKSLKESKRKRKRSTLVEALAFLGLNDAMDIFADVAPVVVDTSHDKRVDVVPSTSIASQEYTVSQILKIVNDRKASQTSCSSAKDRSFGKEIYVGTIDEIFGSIENVADKVPSEKQSASEEEDVIASSQPVISEIKLPSKPLSSTVTNASHHPHFRSSGDDMFSSFSKTHSPIASHRNVPSVSPTSNEPPVTTSPSPQKNGTLRTVERSPSVFRRKVNLSRLKALSMKFNSERMPSNNVSIKSPTFYSCNNLDDKHSHRNDDLQVKLNAEPSDNGSQIDESFKIHRNPNKRNRVLNDTIVEESTKRTTKSTATFKKPKMRRCDFIDDECDVSNGSSDEYDASSDTDLNSIICNEDVHDDTSVDMRAIYLQSVKSPLRKNAYKFAKPTVYRNNINIFSQAIVEDDESDYDASFVVDECSEDEEKEHEMSVLERAEWLLKMKRKEKRKVCNNNSSSVPKRRKIIEYNDSSDDNV